MEMRTHRAGELRPEHVGEEVALAGWVARRRDHGGVVFVDLRDASGIVQVVLNPADTPAPADVIHGLRNEYCIRVEGVVRPRPEGTENPDLPTGAVEVAAARLEVLSPSDPLPFQITDRIDVDEQTRLRYRYLDLRRPRMARNLRARSLAAAATRRTLEELGFLEVETPTLIRSTPEGARDMLVPSRLRKGRFYALPQSPQLFKQLLMIGGVERYFQIARCYRDEDFRSDRQLEFTQIDLEGAFWDRDDVLATVEQVVGAVVRELRGEEMTLPLPRLTYAEAMDRYGTDKPDIRFAMTIEDVSDVFAGTGFRGFATTLESGGVVRAIDAGAIEATRSRLDALVARAQELGAKGLVWMVVEEDGSVRSPVAKFLSEAEVAALVERLGAEPGDVLLLVADSARRASQVLGQLRLEIGQPEGHAELAFLWVVDFPVFEETDDGELVPSHHPFTAPVDVKEMAESPRTAIAKAYDLVVNGVELGSGSVRIHDPETQRRVFEVLGISDEVAERRFGWFLEALRYGTPPHAGFAIGFDRLLAVLQQERSIREVIPFPKTQTGVDPLTRAPSPVEEEQLVELGISLRPEVAAQLEKELTQGPEPDAGPEADGADDGAEAAASS